MHSQNAVAYDESKQKNTKKATSASFARGQNSCLLIVTYFVFGTLKSGRWWDLFPVFVRCQNSCMFTANDKRLSRKKSLMTG